jgi:hypothetical protein
MHYQKIFESKFRFFFLTVSQNDAAFGSNTKKDTNLFTTYSKLSSKTLYMKKTEV